MGSYEADDLTSCADCGAPVSPKEDRVYAFGIDSVLCMECSLRRGGAYDELNARWAVPPRIHDLLARSELRWE
jgi:hypothetical protein